MCQCQTRRRSCWRRPCRCRARAAAQVFADAVDGGRELRGKGFDLELVTVLAVARPLALQMKRLAALHAGQGADDVAFSFVSSRRNSESCSVLLVEENDAFEHAGERVSRLSGVGHEPTVICTDRTGEARKCAGVGGEWHGSTDPREGGTRVGRPAPRDYRFLSGGGFPHNALDQSQSSPQESSSNLATGRKRNPHARLYAL